MDQLRHHHGNTTASSEDVIETQELPGPTDTLIIEPQSHSATAVEPEPAEVTGPGLPFQTQETTSLHSDLTTGAEERHYPVRRWNPPDRLDL